MDLTGRGSDHPVTTMQPPAVSLANSPTHTTPAQRPVTTAAPGGEPGGR